MYPKLGLEAIYSHFQETSAQMTSLSGHFQSGRVRDVISCHVTSTSFELERCKSSNLPIT